MGCFCSVTESWLTPCNPMDYSTSGFPVLPYLPECVQTHVHRVSDAIQPSHPLFPLLLLPSLFPASGSFPSNELALRIRWPKYWSFSVGPSNEYSGLVSFGIDWFEFLVVQASLKSVRKTVRMILKGCGYEPCATPGFVTSRGDGYDTGPEVRLDHSELLVQHSFVKV